MICEHGWDTEYDVCPTCFPDEGLEDNDYEEFDLDDEGYGEDFWKKIDEEFREQ